MISIYSAFTSPRLSYICDLIFHEQLGVDYMIVTDATKLENKCVINYSDQSLPFPCFQIIPQGLLSENNIRNITITVFQLEEKDHSGRDIPAFFKNELGHFAFDIFSAAFFLISRYEEYLCFQPDSYGRFPYEQSLAGKNKWLDRPLVNIWIMQLQKVLQSAFPGIVFRRPSFRTMLTYDIDIAWTYKNKGLIRNIGGLLKEPSLERVNVLLGLTQDPSDCYDYLDKLHEKCNATIIYFFLLATKRSVYDKNIPPSHPEMRKLISRLAGKYKIGLHPSWKSNDYESLLREEMREMQSIIGKKPMHSRQHYLRFQLPDTYRKLLYTGIENEYSMGYGTMNGFRASFADSFFWYDLKKECSTMLRIHPFCFMDANSHFEQGQQPGETMKELEYYVKECAATGGLFISIFHNNILSDKKSMRGWKEMYAHFISQLQ